MIGELQLNPSPRARQRLLRATINCINQLITEFNGLTFDPFDPEQEGLFIPGEHRLLEGDMARCERLALDLCNVMACVRDPNPVWIHA